MCEYKHNHGKPKWKALGMLKYFTCQEIMSIVNDYWKLLELVTKLEKSIESKRANAICSQCHKPKHTKERCHPNHDNPNKKLKEKKDIPTN